MLGRALLMILIAASPAVKNDDFTAAIQEKAFETTVRLENVSRGIKGTAVRIADHRTGVYYLTAAHGVLKNDDVNLESFSANNPTQPKLVVKGKVLECWPGFDLATIRADEPEPQALAKLCPPDAVPVGKNVPLLTIGCSGANAPTIEITKGVRKEIVIPSENRAGAYWQAEKIPAQGRSGGPVFDVKGNLVGICSGTNSKDGYYVHIDDIRIALKKSMQKSFLLPEVAPVIAGPTSNK